MFYRGWFEPFNPWKNCRMSVASVYWQYVLVPVALLRQVPTMRGLRNRVVPTSTGHYQGNRCNQLRIFVHPPFPPLSVHSYAVVDLRYSIFVVGVAVANPSLHSVSIRSLPCPTVRHRRHLKRLYDEPEGSQQWWLYAQSRCGSCPNLGLGGDPEVSQQQKLICMSWGFCASVEAFLSIQVVTELDPRTTIMSVEVVDALSYTVKIDERPRERINLRVILTINGRSLPHFC